MSKIDQVRSLFSANSNKPRLELIDLFQKELGLARATAASYHDAVKKAANKPVAVKPAFVISMAVAPKKEVAPKVAPVKRGSTGEGKLLHTFTKEEMLEVLDEKTRATLEKILEKDDIRASHTVTNGTKAG